ncbi:MAG: cytochrome P450 [Cyanobacteria bacterium J06642_11]
MTVSKLPLPPGNFGLPLIGDTLSFFRDPNYGEKQHAKYGPIFKTRLLGSPTLFVKGAAANQFVLTNENNYFVVSWPPSTKALLGNLSLALQTGGEHQNRRKLLAQAFMPRALSGYIDTVQSITHSYAQTWLNQHTLTWYPELRNYTFDVACKLLVGLDQGAKTELGHLFETWCEGLFSLPLAFPWTRFGKAKKARRQMLVALEEIIRQRQQSADLGNDALSLLIQAKDEDGKGLSIDELKDQVLLLLFAGHETLTSALASFCLLVAQHPQVLEALREEQAGLDATAPLTLDTLRQMPYLEQVLQEVLRLIPPVGGGFRKVLKTCELNGYQIPEGWTVLYEINQTHLNSEDYATPTAFQPERFGKQADPTKKYSYVPFGGGIRECLGKEFARLEMKLFAVELLRHYSWDLLPDQDLSMVVVPTPHPRDNLRVTFQSYGDSNA